MKHFVFAMNSNGRPPAGDGTMEAWFLYYKWDVDGEAFVPLPEDSISPDARLDAGDVLWFILDERPIGCVPILRIEPDPLNHFIEFHYDTRQIQAAPLRDLTHSCPFPSGLAENAQALALAELKLQFDATYPPRASS